MTPERLAESLKRLRLRRGLTQPELAARLDCDASTITHVERGTRQPGIDLLRDWLAVCGGAMVLTDAGSADDALLGLPEPARAVARLVLAMQPDDAQLALRICRVLPSVHGPMKRGVADSLEQLAASSEQK